MIAHFHIIGYLHDRLLSCLHLPLMLHTPPQFGHFLFHQETNPNARPPEQLSNVCLFDEDKIYFF